MAVGAGEGRRCTKATRPGSSVTGATVASAQAPGWSKHLAHLLPPPNLTPPPSSTSHLPPMPSNGSSPADTALCQGLHQSPPFSPSHSTLSLQVPRTSLSSPGSPEGLLWVGASSVAIGHLHLVATFPGVCLCPTHLASPLSSGISASRPAPVPSPLLILCSAPHPTPTTPCPTHGQLPTGPSPTGAPEGSPHCPRPSWSTDAKALSPQELPPPQALGRWA